MLFHFLNFSQCVVCMFGHKKDLQSYKPQKIPFQELQRMARLDYKRCFPGVVTSQSGPLEYH